MMSACAQVTSYLLIANPNAGRGRAPSRARALATALEPSSSVELVVTEKRGGCGRAAEGGVDRVDRVIAVGGDGTLNEVLSGLLASGRTGADLPELGFLPAGTGNVATRAFKLSTDPRTVSRRLPSAPTRAVDIGIARQGGQETPFLLWCGAGWDAAAFHALHAHRAARLGISGVVLQSPRLLRAILSHESTPILVEAAGVQRGGFASVVVANVGEVALVGRLSPDADPYDGVLDLVAVPPLSAVEVAALPFRILTSSLLRAKRVFSLRTDTISLASGAPVPFEVDGEACGTLPAVISVRRGAVRLLQT